MVTVTLDELEFNAVSAALNDRISAMTQLLAKRRADPPSLSRAFAIDAAEMAIRHAMAAQLTLATALPDPEYPADASVMTLIDSVVTAYQGEGR